LKKGNIFISILCILISMYVLTATRKFPNIGKGVPGPSFFPNVLAGLLVFLSILLLIITFMKKENRAVSLYNKNTAKVYITMLLIICYLAGIKIFGLLLSTPFMLFILINFYGMKSYVKNILISIFITSVVYSVFQIFLKVPLPTGTLLG